MVELGFSDSFLRVDYSDSKDIPKVIPVYPNRKVEYFTFNANQEQNKTKLAAVTTRIERLFSEKDTIAGIKILFDEKMEYQTYLNILDVFFVEDVPTYVINSKFLYVVYFPPVKKDAAYAKWREKHPVMNCGTQDAMRVQRLIDNEQKDLAEREAFQKSFFDNHRYLFMLYFGILLLNVFVLIKFNRNRIYNQKSYI
jgi:hypothetical protein